MGSNGAGFGKGWKEFVHERDSFLGDCKATFQKLEKTGQRILKRHIAESLERLDATNPHQSFQRKLKYFDLSYRELMDLIRKNI